jgi:hypothetical protein
MSSLSDAFEGLPPELRNEVLGELALGPPEDLERRFLQLQALLRHQPEFAARFPAAAEILFSGRAKRRRHIGLHLPSFGIRILPNDPGVEWLPQGEFFGGDAYSHTSTRPVLPRAKAALQGVLLTILIREEYGERIQPSPLANPIHPDLFEDVEVLQESLIRITDLRLASALRPRALKRGLVPLLDRLKRPMTAERVIRWKLRFLGEALEDVDETARAQRKPIWAQTELLKWHFGDEGTGIAAVSFAAAALCLLLDLGMPGIKDKASHQLAQDIESLANIVRKLREQLYRGAVELEILTKVPRPKGRQRRTDLDYRALCDYRTGEPLEEIAEKLGIAAYDSGDERQGIIPYGMEDEWLRMTAEQRKDEWEKLAREEQEKNRRKNRDWRAAVIRHLINGKKFEDEHYPKTAVIFANKDDPQIRRVARLAYLEFGRKGFINWAAVSTMIQVESPGTEVDREIANAYLLLGTAIELGREELPQHRPKHPNS